LRDAKSLDAIERLFLLLIFTNPKWNSNWLVV